MKKLLLSCTLFLCAFLSFSQVSRANLAVDIYQSLFGNGANPNNNIASEFPNPYLDLQGSTSSLIPYVNAMCHLEFRDGISVFDRNTILFNPVQNVSRGEMVRVVMEAFNITIANVGDTSPFNDVPNPYFSEYYHIVGAWQAGLIPTTPNFYPYDDATPSFYSSIINFIYSSTLSTPSVNQLNDLDNYFKPNNYKPNNIGVLRGLEQGVFSHYAKNSFVIPDIQFNLNFSHYYSTQLVELPESYFPVKPLGRGWTHPYNAYIIRENNVGVDEIDYYYIVWGDGTIHIFNEDDDEYITKGVYDHLNEYNDNNAISITKKDQTKYRFQKYDNGDIYYLWQIEDKNDNEIEIEHEEANKNDTYRIITVSAPSGKQLDFHYHNNTDFIDYIEDPIGRKIRFTYNEERLKYFYDAKDQETKYYYLSNDEDAPDEHQYKRFLLRKVRLPKGNKIEAEYDDDNGKLESYQINDNLPTRINVNFDDYDAITSTVTVPMPNSGESQDYDYVFNANSMVTQFQNDTQDINITYPDPTDDNSLLPTNVDINGLDINYSYDDNGNVSSIQVENNEDEDFWYDNNNNLTHYRDSNNNDTYLNYDSNNNLISIKDALGNFIFLNYDNHGQVTSITNQEGITVNYTYEDDGAVSTISAPENLTSSFSYDGINRLLTQTINGQTSSYTYDPNDNLTSQTNIGGLTTTYNYDANDSLTTITNAKGVNTSFAYNTKDQVTSETFGSLVKQYEYNDDGTLDNYIKPSGNVIHYDYLSDGKLNDAGTIMDIDYYGSNDGKKESLIRSIATADIRYNFNYDNLNRLDEVEIANEPDLTVSYEYDDIGNITRIYYPNSPSNFYVRYYYDAKNRLRDIKITTNGITKNVVQYYYRNDDKINSIYYHNSDKYEIEKSYNYDDAGRLTGVFYYKSPVGGGIANLLYHQSIELDNRGNIVSDISRYDTLEEEQNFNSQSETYTYNSTNHITQAGSEAININNDGNTTQKGNINYQYDIDDQITSITGNNGTSNINFQLKYDPYGNRIEKDIIAGTTFPETRRYVWDILNNNIIKEYNPNGSEQYFYVYGASGLEFSISPNTGTIDYFFHGDIRGSVVFRSNTNGDVVANHFNKYDDFGNITTYNSPDAEVYGAFYYLGKHGIMNDVTAYDGLYQVKARYYDAKLGRFLTQDPIWSTNLYPYANNNPISNTDINGKYWESAIDVAFLAHNYYEWEKDPNLLNSAALAFDGVGVALPFVAGLGTGLKVGIGGAKYGNEIVSTTKQIHGNSIQSTKPTWGYRLFSSDGTFLKNGITSKLIPESRYTKTFMKDKYMVPYLFPNRMDAYMWEYIENFIRKGPLNKNMH